jgi:hypothetical protein
MLRLSLCNENNIIKVIADKGKDYVWREGFVLFVSAALFFSFSSKICRRFAVQLAVCLHLTTSDCLNILICVTLNPPRGGPLAEKKLE